MPRKIRELKAQVAREEFVQGERFMSRYSMTIQGSDEEQLFLVTVPEFVGRVVMPCTHGKTREEAIQND